MVWGLGRFTREGCGPSRERHDAGDAGPWEEHWGGVAVVTKSGVGRRPVSWPVTRVRHPGRPDSREGVGDPGPFGGSVFRQMRAFRESLSRHLLFFPRLLLRIVSGPKQHVLGCCVPNSFMVRQGQRQLTFCKDSARAGLQGGSKLGASGCSAGRAHACRAFSPF